MTKTILLLIMIVSYGLGYWGCGFVMSSSGDHRYFRARVALERLQWMTRDYLNEHGRLPDTHDFNSNLKTRWDMGRDYLPNEEENDDMKWHLNFIIESAFRDNLHLWNLPPHFVLSPAIPDGFGFYLDGEDGHSTTQGRDPDDINSWDRNSIDFYYDRIRFRQVLRDHSVGAVLAFAVFMIYLSSKRNRRKPTRRSIQRR